MSVSSTTVDIAMAPRRRALRPIAGLRAVVRRPSGAFGVLIVGSLLFLTAFGWLVAPYGSSTQDIPNALQGPTLHHLLGTDYLGRDILSRLIIGTHIELGVAVPAVGDDAFADGLVGSAAGPSAGGRGKFGGSLGDPAGGNIGDPGCGEGSDRPTLVVVQSRDVSPAAAEAMAQVVKLPAWSAR